MRQSRNPNDLSLVESALAAAHAVIATQAETIDAMEQMARLHGTSNAIAAENQDAALFLNSVFAAATQTAFDNQAAIMAAKLEQMNADKFLTAIESDANQVELEATKSNRPVSFWQLQQPASPTSAGDEEHHQIAPAA